jgi:hypothetical protein
VELHDLAQAFKNLTGYFCAAPKATGNNYFTCDVVAFGLMVMSYFGRVAERCRRASINFISLAGTRTPSG